MTDGVLSDIVTISVLILINTYDKADPPTSKAGVTVSSEQTVHPLVKSCLEPMLEACRLCKRRVLLPDPEPAASRIYWACSTRHWLALCSLRHS